VTTAASSSPVLVTVVTPLRNAMRFLPETVPTVLEAARSTGGVEVIYVDNGSTDGSYEYLAATEGCQVERREKVSIAALRNFGAGMARGEYLSFLDADCTIGPRYFDEAIAVMRTLAPAATGFEVQLPATPHWIEETWHNLHAVGSDREVEWINSANFFISREIFHHVGGFREDLLTGEDTELGQRLIRSGYRVLASRRLAVTHLGNPRSIREFHRQKVWHGLGMFGTVNRDQIDKPTAMMIVHLVATIAGLLVLIGGPFNWAVRGLMALALQVVVPSVSVAYRAWSGRRVTDVPKSVFLYWIYYWARLQALVLVLTGYGDKYIK
jgi:glycosyltransferase involved in cell wall biosynthesis